jgi:acyl carrier protein
VQQLAIDIQTIRKVLAQHGRLSHNVSLLEPDSDLYDAGLTSLATVSVMLALEDHFNVEFPESMLSRRTFESLDSIAEAVAKLAG